MSAVPPGRPYQPDADRSAAASSQTPPAELTAIAGRRPDLHVFLAANPASSPELLTWLRSSTDPAVQSALNQRGVPGSQQHPYPLPPAPPAAGYQPAAPYQGGYQGGTPSGYQMTAPYPPPASPPQQPVRKSRKPLIIGAVLGVIVLVAAGVGVTALVHRMTSRPAARDISAAWVDGSHQLWTLAVPEDSYVRGNGDQLVVAAPGSQEDRRSVTAYDVSGNKSKEQWSTEVDADDDGFRFEYWGDYLIVGDELLSPSDGTAIDAPWEASTQPGIVDTYAYHCGPNNTCTAWSADDPNTTLWEKDIKNSGIFFAGMTNAFPTAGRVYQDDQVTYVLVASDKAVNLATGDVIDFELDSNQWIVSLSDGWLKGGLDSDEYTVLSPTGQQTDSFRGGSGSTRSAPFTFDLPQITAERYRGLIVDGDFSWARVQAETDFDTQDDTFCRYTYFIDGTELATTAENWDCDLDYVPYFKFSADESLLMLTSSSPMQTASVLSLRGIWTVPGAELVTVSDYRFGEEQYYLFNSELIVVHDGTNSRLIGYAPGSN